MIIEYLSAVWTVGNMISNAFVVVIIVVIIVFALLTIIIVIIVFALLTIVIIIVVIATNYELIVILFTTFAFWQEFKKKPVVKE